MAAAARKTVTVLFCDLADSTPLGDSMDAEALRALYGRYYDAARAAIERHGGTVEKFIGDAVMAVFGIPLANEDDALRAVRAAVEVRAAAQALELTPRIGIDTGEVVAGDSADGHAFVTGPAIVVAERLEKAAGPGGILVGDATYRLVAHAVEAEGLDPLALKGKASPVTAWRVHAVEADAPALARRLDAPLVDREREQAQLRAELERTVAERRCRLLSILGPAGVGKTRLVLEVTAGFGDRVRVVGGRCRSYGEGTTLQAAAEAVRDALASGVQVDDERVSRALSALVGESDEQLPTEETFWAVRRLLETLAAERPLVVVFDDVEWGEPTFLDLIEYLVGWSREEPILLVCLARSELLEERPEWGTTAEGTAAMAVGPLADDDAMQVVLGLAGGDVDEETSARIVGAAAGNPLFAEELLRMLVDDGALRNVDGRWQSERPLEQLAIPRSVRAVLAARLDRLAPTELAALQRGAVLGDEFWWSGVAALDGDDADRGLGKRLQALVRKQLLLPARSSLPGEDAFRFGHPLIRDAAYDALPKSQRAVLHERAAAWLDAREDALSEHDELVGHHLERAFRSRVDLEGETAATLELAARAGGRLAEAGERALARGDASAARALLERAAALLDGPALVDGLVSLGIALRLVGDLEGAVATLEDACARAEDADLAHREHARLELLHVRLMRDPHGVSPLLRETAESALAVFTAGGDERGLAKAWYLIGQERWIRLQMREAEQAFERALAHAERGGDRGQRAAALGMLARTVALGPGAANVAIVRCLELLEQAAGAPALEAALRVVLGVLHGLLGDFEAARSSIGAGRAVFEELGVAPSVAGARGYAGMVELLAGDAAAAEQELRVAYEAFERIGELGGLSLAAAYLARALVLLGRDDEAMELAATAERVAWAQDTASHVIARGVRARVLAARGQHAEARALAEGAVAAAAETDFFTLHADALLDLAEVHAAAGAVDAAAEAAADARAARAAKVG